MRSMFAAALREWRLSTEGGVGLNLGTFRERVQATMEVEAQRSMGRLERGLLFLATVGAAGPFIGLFGTVWGIMNSFTAIAGAKDTSIAVVAPGIAEALFATALGLVAAIPAVVFYNKFSNDIATLGVAAREFLARVLGDNLAADRSEDGRHQAGTRWTDGWGNRRVKSRFAPRSEINVTPFVDVMLVLLIIFMVAAPLMTVTVPVNLAQSDAKPKTDAAPLTITVTGDGKIYLQEDEVAMGSLVPVIRERALGDLEQRIYVRGDRSVNYERVMQVMSFIDEAGFTRIGLMGTVSQSPK